MHARASSAALHGRPTLRERNRRTMQHTAVRHAAPSRHTPQSHCSLILRPALKCRPSPLEVWHCRAAEDAWPPSSASVSPSWGSLVSPFAFSEPESARFALLLLSPDSLSSHSPFRHFIVSHPTAVSQLRASPASTIARAALPARYTKRRSFDRPRNPCRFRLASPSAQ